MHFIINNIFKNLDYKKEGGFKIKHFKGINHFLPVVRKDIHFHGLLTVIGSFYSPLITKEMRLCFFSLYFTESHY